ncbi:MAG: 2-phospho-L-lactate transferase [Actinobacteria bacterium]|jgi:LPPG:FO 2-phospho-L-lactate transferase|nr:2-phospho-L-lactate transferase [Actinomycetota bacterium]MCL6095838.1 2-phospho-L-lactate transferase [Actinomycetota bacterium]
MITALAGGVGGARMLEGLTAVIDPSDITAVVNTGDDTIMHGLHISPDIDTVTYKLAGIANKETGWGIQDDTWEVMDALLRLGGETWFRLGDKDLATHLFRTQRLREGATLTTVTLEVARALGVAVRILPMSDDPVSTKLDSKDGIELEFQEYFVKLRHSVPIAKVRYVGADRARAAPGVLSSLEDASKIVICPSNPILSIGPIKAVPEIGKSLLTYRDKTVAISPIISGRALRGPADHLLAELGYEPSVVGVAALYSEFAKTLIIDEADRDLAQAVEKQGINCFVAPTVMNSRDDAVRLASNVLTLP